MPSGRGKSPAARTYNGAVVVSSGGVPGPAAKNTASGAGGTGAAAGGTGAAVSGGVVVATKPEISAKIVAMLVWLFLAFATTMNKGQKWQFFISSSVACAAFKVIYDLDEKHPSHKSLVFGVLFLSSVAFMWFDMIAYFECDEAFLKWFVGKMPELEKVYTFAHKQLKLYSNSKPAAGVKKTVMDHATFVDVIMKLRNHKSNNKWFGIF
jgi:hypothetical protein